MCIVTHTSQFLNMRNYAQQYAHICVRGNPIVKTGFILNPWPILGERFYVFAVTFAE